MNFRSLFDWQMNEHLSCLADIIFSIHPTLFSANLKRILTFLITLGRYTCMTISNSRPSEGLTQYFAEMVSQS